jgi:hypothetical protein
VIPVARKLWMPSLVAILLQERACQRPAFSAAEVRNMPLSRAALTSYQASHAIRDRLAKADPGNAGGQRDLRKC